MKAIKIRYKTRDLLNHDHKAISNEARVKIADFIYEPVRRVIEDLQYLNIFRLAPKEQSRR